MEECHKYLYWQYKEELDDKSLGDTFKNIEATLVKHINVD